jgi:hypothetical protein
MSPHVSAMTGLKELFSSPLARYIIAAPAAPCLASFISSGSDNLKRALPNLF